MPITRNNHPDIYPAGPTYVRAVRAGNTLYISGCTARGSSAENEPPMNQLRVTLGRIIKIVEAERGDSSNIVAITTYVTDMKQFWPIEGEHQKIYEEVFRGHWPTNSYVQVAGLAEPNLCVELTATAFFD